MGTRIYPLTQNVTNLEKLAGVPIGTSQRLKEFLSENPASSSEERYMRYLKLIEDEELSRYYHFQQNGFGKPRSYRDFDVYVCNYENSKVTDLKVVQTILKRHLGLTKVEPNLCEGLCWGG